MAKYKDFAKILSIVSIEVVLKCTRKNEYVIKLKK